jgi:hypothetical protein
MQRLRHPVRAIREPFGKAGLTVAILALVLAMVGGAYAAGGLTKSQEKQVTKIAKKFAGKPGATGPAGAAGTNGTNGKDGSPGAAGAPGANGKGVVIAAPAAPGCPAGGKSVEVEGSGVKSNICNGNPAEFPESLPEGKTLRGVFGASTYAEAAPPTNPGFGRAVGAVNFALPVSPFLALSQVHYIAKEEGEGEPNEAAAVANGECTGTVANPGAAAGQLCVFGESEVNLFAAPNVAIDNVSGTTPGFKISAFAGAKGAAWFEGTWAVTAP